MLLSAVLITLNEEKNIARCLESLRGVADEVIVLDSFSKDETALIAEKMGARVFQLAFTGYGEQKAAAIGYATHDWILSIDADEALSPELRDSILDIKKAPVADAYSFNRLTNYCGQWINHCGWYPDKLLRLINRKKARMTTDKVHEGFQLAPGAKEGFLKGDLLHYSFPTISAHLKKIEQYSEIGARFDVARGKKVSFLKLWLGPKWVFLQSYLLRAGFLDGYYGYIICKNSAFAAFAKYAKIRQYTKLKKENAADWQERNLIA